MKVAVGILAGAVAVIALLFAGCSALVVGAASAVDTPGPAPVAGPIGDGFTAGVRLVGPDFPPGAYSTSGPATDSALDVCYWARLSDTSGEFDALIANDVVQGPAVVTVEADDVAFETTGGCVWVPSG
ncbi:MAG: hypothetical protein L0I76_31370 [Pseudonocardia sp.]|nr:hypothetical protein [Pseudonocardia sp.]